MGLVTKCEDLKMWANEIDGLVSNPQKTGCGGLHPHSQMKAEVETGESNGNSWASWNGVHIVAETRETVLQQMEGENESSVVLFYTCT